MQELRSARYRVGDYELHYVTGGSGAPLVFLHGVLGSHALWTDLARDLAQDHQVVVPDLFGCGMSAKPKGDYSLGAHAGFVRDLLDALGLDRVTLIGHSLGGGIALEFTYLFPQRVERLVLVASGGLGRDLHLLLRAPTLPGADWVLPVVASRWTSRPGHLLARTLKLAGVRGGSDVALSWEYFEQLADRDSRRAFLATIRAVAGIEGQRATATGILHTMTQPILLVWGDQDWIIPIAHAESALGVFPDARLEIFEGSGHFPHLDDPQRFTDLVRRFTALTPVDDAPDAPARLVARDERAPQDEPSSKAG